MADAASPNAPPTALIAMDGVSVRVTDSRFEGLHVPQDTLLLVTNGSLLVQNTTFTRNQAALHAAFMAQEMLHVSVQRSTFSSSAGRVASC